MQYERKFGPRLAPLLVEQCVDFIRDRGLDEEGLFRMPGQANLVKELQEAFDCGDKPLFDRYRPTVEPSLWRVFEMTQALASRRPCNNLNSYLNCSLTHRYCIF